MGQVGTLIAQSAALTTAYAERLISGIAPASFARFAAPGGQVIRSNHPAFIFGHLGLYPSRIMQTLGKPPGETAYPPQWDALFKAGVECQDDPNGTIYPPMSELTGAFMRSYKAALGAIAEASDAQLLAPNPTEGRLRELFPLTGAMFSFYVGGHPQMHFGQISAWRRMMGLPPAA